MARKPTYEALQRRVKELEEEASKRKRGEETILSVIYHVRQGEEKMAMRRTNVHQRLRVIIAKPLFLLMVFIAILLISGCSSREDGADYHTNRGVAHAKKGQYGEAISDFDKAIEIDPKFAGAYANRGNAYYGKGEHDKAWEDVNRAQSLGVQVHPGFLKALREASGRER